MAELDSAIRAQPDAVRLYEAKAQLAMFQKDYASAERTFQALKLQQPKQAVGYLRLGQVYTQQNKMEASLKEYDAAALVAPQDTTPYVASIGALVGMKRFDDANARIGARQKAEPGQILHLQLLGDVAVARKDLPAAEKAYRSAIAAAPTIPMGYLNTARVQSLSNQVDAALQTLSAGEKAIPDDLQLPSARAELLTRTNRTDEAIAVYEALIKRRPDDDNLVNNLAFLLVEAKGDRASMDRALTLAGRFSDSRNAGYMDTLGWIHHKLGEYDKSVPLLEKAVALAPSSPLLNLHLGKSLVKSGNAVKGKEYLRKAVDSKANLPNLDEARAMLAQG
jgi:predicted Zn-dependent protease